MKHSAKRMSPWLFASADGGRDDPAPYDALELMPLSCLGRSDVPQVWLTVLGGLAEFERELIRSRTDEGRKRAQARGVRFGRKLKLTPHQRREALARRQAGESLVEIGRSYNVSHSTISRLAALGSAPFVEDCPPFIHSHIALPPFAGKTDVTLQQSVSDGSSNRSSTDGG
jgi:Helix-turn-helix domain/Resolvase, N terminal domain